MTTFSWRRAGSVVLRQAYLIRGSLARVLPLFAWVATDMILWGFLTRYLNGVTRSAMDFVPTLLGAVLLWDFFARVMQGVTTAFLEDVWSRNFLNLFASPLSIPEYVAGLVASSIMTSAIGLVVMIEDVAAYQPWPAFAAHCAAKAAQAMLTRTLAKALAHLRRDLAAVAGDHFLQTLGVLAVPAVPGRRPALCSRRVDRHPMRLCSGRRRAAGAARGRPHGRKPRLPAAAFRFRAPVSGGRLGPAGQAANARRRPGPAGRP